MAVNYHGKKFYNIDPRVQCYEIYYGCNIQIFLISLLFVPDKHFQPSLMFEGEARSLPYIGAPATLN
jgi:hypothetical protein